MIMETLQQQNTIISNKNPNESVSDSLDRLFPEQEREEKTIKHAKVILGTLASQYSPPEFKNMITEVQYLAESWLDDFEREIFNGKTLKELLHEKGSP